MRKADRPSGRVTFDDRGDASWEWETDTGLFGSSVDTQRLRALTEGVNLSLVDDVPQGSDPRQQPVAAPQAARRRSIDDLRKLSEEIKLARALKSR